MKVVLLVLSGDSAMVRAKLAAYYPEASIETLSRGEFETESLTKRLRTLRTRQADVFVIATERLAWQRAQNLFMLFGALAGAKEVLMIDAHGGVLRKSRSNLLFGAPARLSHEALIGVTTFAKGQRALSRLEREVEAVSLRNGAPERGREISCPRVVYIRATPGPGTQAGGAASHMKGVVEALGALAARVDIISNDAIPGVDVPDDRFKIIEPQTVEGPRALFDIHNNLVFTNAAIPLIERANPDFIYQRYARFSWVGVVATLRTKRPLFLEYNGSEVWVGRHWDRIGNLDLLERYERLNLQAAARIFVVSEVERRNLEVRRVPLEKIVVNPNGVNVDLFRPKVGGMGVRRELGIAHNEIVVGFVGTFGPWHGVLTLAEAIKRLPAKTRIRFLLVGSGSLHYQVEQLLKAQRETRQVIFTGSVEHERVPALLDACDILVAPHLPLADGRDFFGSPTKLFEYMAMEKGIVASSLGQIGDVLTHEDNALLVEPGETDQLAAAILRQAGSAELRRRLGQEARRTVVENYTWKHNAQRVLDAYLVYAGKQIDNLLRG